MFNTIPLEHVRQMATQPWHATRVKTQVVNENVRGKLQRNRERMTVRGLNDNHNRDLKNLFKKCCGVGQQAGPCQTKCNSVVYQELGRAGNGASE